MQIQRKKTRVIHVGNVPIGGENPVVIQSMTNTKTYDVDATLKQIQELHAVGCRIVRVAIPSMDDALAVKELVKWSPVPLIADIHYDYTLALKTIENGIQGVRINPGTMENKEKVALVIDACKQNNVAVRIGVNAGSLEKHIMKQYGTGAKAMVTSITEHIQLLESLNFYNFKVSLKSSSVLDTIEAYRLFSEKFDYPVHVGITEAGSLRAGTVKSSFGIGLLLYQGIGDTLRVSLTADPIEEVFVAKELLHMLGLLEKKVEVISCPTCGRTEIPLFPLLKAVEDYVQNIPVQATVAVMGCPVNGIGEAKFADIGIAGGMEKGIIFKKGTLVRSVPAVSMKEEFLAELQAFLEEKIKEQENTI